MTSSTSSSKPGLLQGVVAILSPVLVLAVAVMWLGQAPEPGALSEAAAEIEAELTEASPRVIVLGNSLAHSDIDAPRLAQALGMEAHEVYVLYSPGSRAPWWYAALKNRVYANDHEPELIVVVNTMASLLSTRPHTEWSAQLLRDQMTDYEPVLEEHLYGTQQGSALWERMKARRVTVRAGLLDGVRDRAVSTLHGIPAEPALERVFDAETSVDMALHSRVIPVVESSEDVMDRQGEGSLLPELLALAADAGSRVVFVRVPLSSTARGEDILPAADEREAILALNAAGAGYLDLHEADYTDADFIDPRHMSPAGRTRLTDEVVDGLAALGASGSGAMPPAALSLALRVDVNIAREGTLPTLPLTARPGQTPCGHTAALPGLTHLRPQALLAAGLGQSSPLVITEDNTPLIWSDGPVGQTCSGTFRIVGDTVEIAPRAESLGALHLTLSEDTPQAIDGLAPLYWLHPGTTLSVHITEQGGEDTPLHLRLRTLDDQAPTVILGEKPLTLRREGAHWIADSTLSGGTGSLRLSSPENGPTALLVGLRIGAGEEVVSLLAESTSEAPTSLLQGRIRHTGEAPVLSLAEPITLTGPKVRAAVVGFPFPQLAALSDTGVLRITYGQRASPIEVLEDGVLLVAPTARKTPPGQKVLWPNQEWWDARCAWIDASEGTRFCHSDENLLLLTADQTPPDPERYTMRLREDRQIPKVGWWLYPGDRMVASVKVLPAEDLPHGATGVVLSGLALDPDDTTPITIRLRVGKDNRWSATLPANQLNEGPRYWPLDTVLIPPLNDVRLIVSTGEGGGYVVLTGAGLVNRQ
ncbi:MAG: hypothetical protein ACI8RZ_003626 [Myxococcota bacterium]|jgi:hypothetical protein